MSNNRYQEIRDALEILANGHFIAPVIAATIRELLAERDALREALEAMVEMVEMNGFGKAYAMDVARAALKQEADRG